MHVSRLFCCVQGDGLPRSRCSLAMTKKERYQTLAMPEGEGYAGGKRGMPEGRGVCRREPIGMERGSG